MTINQILAEQMKEFEKEFSNGGKGKQWDGYWEDVDMFISTVKIEDVKAFIHSYTRKLIESLAEEIITCDPYADLKLSEEMQGGRFKLRQEQRIKKKEILSNLK